jgi:hypothetical protein
VSAGGVRKASWQPFWVERCFGSLELAQDGPGLTDAGLWAGKVGSMKGDGDRMPKREEGTMVVVDEGRRALLTDGFNPNQEGFKEFEEGMISVRNSTVA